MLVLFFTAKFKKDYKKAKKQGRDMETLKLVLEMLQREEKLPEQFRDHELAGSYKNHRECHLAPDWLLIYRIDRGRLTLTATRLGSHSDLFE
jgi:mRNA interferase YafQ